MIRFWPPAKPPEEPSARANRAGAAPVKRRTPASARPGSSRDEAVRFSANPVVAPTKSKIGRPKSALARPLVLFLLFLIFGGVILGRLIYIQVFAAADLHNAAVAQRTVTTPTPARRGTIYDRNGMVLATSVDTVSIYANTLQIADPTATAYVLAQVLGGTAADWQDRLENPGPGVTNVCLLRYADPSVEAALRQKDAELQPFALELQRLAARLDPAGGSVWTAVTPLTGINYDHEYKRVYPYGSLGDQAIGTLNANGHGQSGLECEYDQILAGQDGQVSVEVGYDGTPLPNGQRSETAKIDGEDIVISLDIELQDYVEQQLASYGSLGNTNNGSVTIVDGATGEIYAAASLPLYDRDTVTTEQIAAGAMSLQGLITPFEPGSTMKAVTAAGALEAGAVSTTDTFNVPDSVEIDGYRIKDWYTHPQQVMNLRDILLNSSNVGIAEVGALLGRQGLFDYFFRAGFYQPTHVDYVGLDGVGEPVYLTDRRDPTSNEYVSIADKPQLWSNVHFADLCFGQGLEVTALSMASFYGAIANDGLRYDPHFLIARPQHPELVKFNSTQIMSSATAATLTDLLESVITEGTGKPAAVPGYRIAGKTGTAEVAGPDGTYTGHVVQSMVGYFMNSPCKLVCMVSMSDAGLVGAGVAPKPLFASLMSYMANRYMVEPAALSAGSGDGQP